MANPKYIKYGDKKIPMPDDMTLESAKEIMARHFPELAEPKIETKKEKDETVYVFTKQMGRKGADKHTPGPWRVFKYQVMNAFDRTVTIPILSENGTVANVECDGVEPNAADIADARLIAAAPDMLDALQAMCDTFGLMFDNYPPPDEFASDAQARAIVESARRVLAKARGENQ